MSVAQWQSNIQTNRKQLAKSKVYNSNTFVEGNLLKHAGIFSHQLDVGASNLYNNKSFIRESINRVRFQSQNKTNNNIDSIIVNETQLNNSVMGDINGSIRSNDKEEPLQSNKKAGSKMVIIEGANLDSKQFQSRSVTQSIIMKPSQNETLREEDSVDERTPQSRIVNSSDKKAIEDEMREPFYQKQEDPYSPTSKTIRTISVDIGNQYSTNRYQNSNDANKSQFTLQSSLAKSTQHKRYGGLGGMTPLKMGTADAKSTLKNIQRLREIKAKGQIEGQVNKYSNISMYQSNKTDKMQNLMQYTQDSRVEYYKNKAMKDSSFLAPIDKGEESNFQFEYLTKRNSHSVLGNAKIMKNNQTFEFEEPFLRNQQLKQKIDLINNTILQRAENVQNGKVRYVTQFYEQESRPHFSPQYRQKVEKFPNLYSRKKTEITKFINALPSTSLIIKSNFRPSLNNKF